MKAEVTRGSSPLSEAQVVFEIWPKGAGPESHAQLLAKPGESKGSYELKGEFARERRTTFITHITPEDTGQMTMASFEFEIQ
ncbi:hypothetical protein [Cohnella faecalis]|uniref:YtkA-like domain-containing protein n=1 Tax=Cohnella faecalis TaxID=2315694 RepID=A0A398CGQ5_9BACL|nr:hypothetical protein [Cohnella faecalis]RIE01923.1 hypothetical protein D3H35_14185 [Cohnella faecalis]